MRVYWSAWLSHVPNTIMFKVTIHRGTREGFSIQTQWLTKDQMKQKADSITADIQTETLLVSKVLSAIVLTSAHWGPIAEYVFIKLYIYGRVELKMFLYFS